MNTRGESGFYLKEGGKFGGREKNPVEKKDDDIMVYVLSIKLQFGGGCEKWRSG